MTTEKQALAKAIHDYLETIGKKLSTAPFDDVMIPTSDAGMEEIPVLDLLWPQDVEPVHAERKD